MMLSSDITVTQPLDVVNFVLNGNNFLLTLSQTDSLALDCNKCTLKNVVLKGNFSYLFVTATGAKLENVTLIDSSV